MLGIAPVDALRDVSLRIEKGDFALVVSVVFALILLGELQNLNL